MVNKGGARSTATRGRRASLSPDIKADDPSSDLLLYTRRQVFILARRGIPVPAGRGNLRCPVLLAARVCRLQCSATDLLEFFPTECSHGSSSLLRELGMPSAWLGIPSLVDERQLIVGQV
jgi:hypothetical protein